MHYFTNFHCEIFHKHRALFHKLSLWNFSQTLLIISQIFIVKFFTDNVKFFTNFYCEFFHRHCALFHKYQFQEISTLWNFSPIFDKKPACEIFHKSAPAGARRKTTSLNLSRVKSQIKSKLIRQEILSLSISLILSFWPAPLYLYYIRIRIGSQPLFEIFYSFFYFYCNIIMIAY